jgi:flagellar biosynthesis/type III secretory pathway protein FliH
MGRLVKGQGYVLPKVVLSANEEAAGIIAAAVAESDFLAARAAEVAEQERQRGYQEGLALGRQEAMASFTEILVRARQDAEEIRVATRDGAIPLARRMAERIVGRALELHPSLIADIANQALAASRARSGPVVLRVNPEDLSHLESQRARLVARLPSAVDLKVTADEKVARGGCVIETASARLDAQLGHQLDALEKALQDRPGASERR